MQSTATESNANSNGNSNSNSQTPTHGWRAHREPATTMPGKFLLSSARAKRISPISHITKNKKKEKTFRHAHIERKTHTHIHINSLHQYVCACEVPLRSSSSPSSLSFCIGFRHWQHREWFFSQAKMLSYRYCFLKALRVLCWFSNSNTIWVSPKWICFVVWSCSQTDTHICLNNQPMFECFGKSAMPLCVCRSVERTFCERSRMNVDT